MRITRNNAANLPIFVEIRKFSQKKVQDICIFKKNVVLLQHKISRHTQ